MEEATKLRRLNNLRKPSLLDLVSKKMKDLAVIDINKAVAKKTENLDSSEDENEVSERQKIELVSIFQLAITFFLIPNLAFNYFFIGAHLWLLDSSNHEHDEEL